MGQRDSTEWALVWGLTDLAPLAETPTSRLWRATSPVHGGVVLKLLTPRGREERHGFRLMQACGGQGMARAYAQQEDACLMEYLPGPSLGDLVRHGRDAEAAEALAGVAAAIRAVPVPSGLAPLETHLAALTRCDAGAFPVAMRPFFHEARAVAAELFATAPDPVALHGDLHLDNILRGQKGWRAIDAKGLTGDPAFETANSFRNPWDRQDLARDPDRARRLAGLFAARLGLPCQRLLDWAFVQVAVSLAWFAEDAAKLDDDLALLPVFAQVRRSG